MKAIIPFLILQLIWNASEAEIEATPYTYEKLLVELEEAQEMYPEVLSFGTIGQSEQGRSLPYVKIGKGDQHILLIGTHHAREWITSQFLLKLVQEYAEAYKKHGQIGDYDTAILDQAAIIVIPMLNPDGVSIQQKGLSGASISERMKILSMNHFSLNFSRWKANAFGVDLNRQYPSGWSELQTFPAWPSYKQYRGKHPAEAVEVQQLMKFTVDHKPELAISYHTSGREVFWYYKNNKSTIEKDFQIAAQIAKKTDYALSFPDKDAVGGGYTDWFISTFQKPGYTIEMCESVHETNPPLSCLNNEWEGNKEVPLMLLHEVIKNAE